MTAKRSAPEKRDRSHERYLRSQIDQHRLGLAAATQRAYQEGRKAGRAEAAAMILAMKGDLRDAEAKTLVSVVLNAAAEQAQYTPVHFVVESEMTGFIATLSPEQREAALSYGGDDTHGEPAPTRDTET